MTKLVSRNPILRFKEGRKIIKAYEGFKTKEGSTGNYYYTGRDGKNYVASLYGNKWVYGLDDGNFKVIGDVPKNYETTGGIKFYSDLGQALSREAIARTPRKPWTPEQIKADRAAKGDPDTTITVELAERNNKANQDKVTVNPNTNNRNSNIKTDTHYIGTRGNSNLYTRSAQHAGVTNRDQVRALQRELGVKDDGIWGNETQKAWASRNGLQFTSPGIGTGVKEYNTGILNEDGSFTPNGSTYQNPREAVKSTVAELNPLTSEYMDEPGRFSIGTALNRGNVRSNRNLYRNVDEYYNWLNTDAGANSDDYKLFANTGLWAPNISEENRRAAFNEMMNQYGISGNLGRRDSGRLANLLNNLSSLGNNSDMRGAFVDAYNNALDEASRTGSDGTVYSNSRVRDLFDKIVVNPAIRYRSSALSWLSTPSNVSNASLGIKTPGNADYGTLLKYKFMPNRFNFYRNGGLIPRDPIDLFKIRKGASGFKAAFDAARAKGLATFSYKGNDYNTRKSNETEELWARNVLKGRGNTVAGSRAQGRVHYKGQDAVVNERTGQVTKVNGGGFKIVDSKGKLVKGGFRTQAEADAYRKKNHITGLIKNEQKQTSMAYSDQSAKASGPTKVVGRGSNQGRTTTRKTNNNGTSITVGKSDPKPSGAVAQRKTRTGDNIKANEATSFINAADFFDAISPTTAIANGISAGINNLAGVEYKPFVAQFGLNPFGYAKDITEGNLGNLAFRGIDTYALAGAPGMAEGTDWLLTKTAPRLNTVTRARYIPKGGLENGTLNKWNWNSLARRGNQATQSSFNKGVRGVVEGGRRSMQRAADEGMLHGFNGADKAAQWGTNFAQNANTGTTYFYRGAPTAYDVAADNAVQVAPWMVPAIDYSTQIIANQE